MLAEIADIDRKVAELNAQIDQLKDRRSHLESLVCEEMTTQRLDGVRVAGRSWRVEWDHSMSVPMDRRDAVLEAARQAGCEDALVQVNTLRLKSVLKEMAKDAGRDSRGLFSDGTPFAGLVGEFVQARLRHTTLPGARS
jgi:hypothetical protein